MQLEKNTSKETLKGLNIKKKQILETLCVNIWQTMPLLKKAVCFHFNFVIVNQD